MLFRTRPRVKFEAVLLLSHLSNVPLVNGYLFIKWRQKTCGSGVGATQRVPIMLHQTRWNEEVALDVTCSVDPETSVLENAWVHLSVRLETGGGKSYDELGSVLLDLSEYAGTLGKPQSRKYLLRDSMLNATMEVTVTMRQTSGDRIYKATPSTWAPSSDNTEPTVDMVRPLNAQAEEQVAFEAAVAQMAHVDVYPIGLNYRQLRYLAPHMPAAIAIANAHDFVADVFRQHNEMPPQHADDNDNNNKI